MNLDIMKKVKQRIIDNKWFKGTLLTVLAYLCVLSLAKLISLHGEVNVFWGGIYFGFNITAIIIFGMNIWLLKRFSTQAHGRKRVFSIIGGLLFSAAIVYGAYVHYVNDIFMSVGDTFLQFGMILSIAALTVPVFGEVFGWIQKGSDWLEKGSVPRTELTHKKCSLVFLLTWLGIFLAYMPLFLAWWPGNFVFDARYQMQNVLWGMLSTHHPLVHTLLMGNAYKFGKAVADDVSWGFQFYTLFQMLVLTSAFAYTVLYLYKKHAPKVICIAAGLWFALFPMNAIFAISATKDVLCAAFFLYFMIFLVRFVFDKEAFAWYSYVGFIVNGVLLSLFRNNALYAVAATGVILVVFAKGWKLRVRTAVLFLLILVLAKGCNEALIAATDATSNTKYREMMSVPLQCMARVASYHPDKLSEEYYEELCMYVEPSTIGAYNPYNADPIKNTANEELLKTNMFNFFKLWLKIGMQFPGEYVESFLTNTMGYWYPLNQGYYVATDLALYHTLIGEGDEIEKIDYCNWAFNWYWKYFGQLKYREYPIIGYSFRNAPYVWLTIIYTLWCFLKKQYKAVLLAVLPLVYLMTCMLGPLAALRYIYSIIVCTPLLLYMLLKKEEHS